MSTQNDDSPATTTNTSTTSKSNNNAPGSLLGYFINRKLDSTHPSAMQTNNSHNVDASDNNSKRQKHKRQSSNRKYHEMVNTGGSTYFGSVLLDDSDSDDDAPMMRSSTSNANVDAPSTTAKKSWLASYQNKPSLPIPSKDNSNIESSTSWVSQAWQTVDSAKEWMLSTSPQQSEVDQTITSNWTSSITTAVSNTMSSISSINPFTNDNDTSNSTSQQQTDNTNNSTSNKQYSPTKSPSSSKFDWSTKPSNPYQAVIGRGDTDILLYSSYPSSYYSYSFSWIHNILLNWTRVLSRYLPPLHWITSYQHATNNSKLLENDDTMNENEKQGRELLKLSMGRKKSQPSEASVQAVKNLLLLVQQQVAEEEAEDEIENVEGSGDVLEEENVLEKESIEDEEKTQAYPPLPLPTEPSTSSTSPPTSPKSKTPSSPAMIPTLSTSNPLMTTTPTPLYEDPNVSFDSEPSYDISLHSLTPARASPGVVHKSQSVEPFSPISLRRANSSPFIDNNKPSGVNMGNSKDKNGNNNQSNHNNTPSSNNNHQAIHAEMAARLAEGTLRAYRDLALDEATELHSALHHWTIRWERPFLGWLEAGPSVWFSEVGYSPHLPGKKVSQLQAVLARRCAVIGELQQHLWRANWRKGVAEWGMLGGGVGGEWASVVGELGGMEAPSSKSTGNVSSSTTQLKIFNHSNLVGTNVSNLPGGGIVVDQEDMTMWSIDAMRVIRDQLYRALPNSKFKELPFVENWPRERRHFGIGEEGDNDEETTHDLPTWAQDVSSPNNTDSHVIITDLNKMSIEVTALLQSIEIHLEQQRVRRLNRLRPPSRLRRRWYFVAAGIPIGAFVIHKLTKEHGGIYIVKRLISKIGDIYRDHVSEPINSIYQELFTPSGRLDVTDRKARVDAIMSLKRMIRSWLEENKPTMSELEMIERSEAMDISLIEEKMEESIKHIYEINSVVRMSLIEMQFIKKELLSALVSMDELMGSNEINMQIAAMTPALMLLLAIRKGFRLLFYAVFQMGKSKEEIYSNFRQTILDIERLLLMRDNPPPPPSALEWGSSKSSTNNNESAAELANTKELLRTLSAEDLGMLLLHIHECRNILWQSRRRFRSDVLRNVAEDLAELAGERGPVSVTQQLQIISRMSRTYPFMKVMSSSVPFEMIIPGTG